MPGSPVNPPCPCGLPARLAACCGRWMAGPLHLAAPDAQALMRSRYTAHVHRDAAYLLATWHASTRPQRLDLKPGQRWLGLQVLQHLCAGDNHASVSFVARSKLLGRAQALAETSRFVREASRWFYLDGGIGG